MTSFSFSEARDLIGAAFKQSGLYGRGSVWRMNGPDVQCVIQIDRPPNRNRVGVDIGLDLQVETTPRRPTDCSILLHLENLSFAFEDLSFTDDLPLRMALDLDSGMQAEDRSQELSKAAKALAAYLHQHVNFTQVADAYRSGHFRAGFIHKEARASLDRQTD